MTRQLLEEIRAAKHFKISQTLLVWPYQHERQLKENTKPKNTILVFVFKISKIVPKFWPNIRKEFNESIIKGKKVLKLFSRLSNKSLPFTYCKTIKNQKMSSTPTHLPKLSHCTCSINL